MLKSKKGQVGIQDAPMVIMVVGMVFLLLATMAYIGNKFGNAVDTDNAAATSINESLARPTTAGITLTTGNNKENGVCGTITRVINDTTGAGYLITAGNYTQTGCTVVNTTDWVGQGFTANVRYTYPYTFSEQTIASNITGDLETEISNNTSIAGIVLTISLVGIILAVLIGVFVVARNRGM